MEGMRKKVQIRLRHQFNHIEYNVLQYEETDTVSPRKNTQKNIAVTMVAIRTRRILMPTALMTMATLSAISIL